MNRAQKEAAVADLHAKFSDAPLVILTDFKGSTVSQLDAMRRACEPAGASFQVVKNTLAKRALASTGMEDLGEHFKGNIAVIISGDDPGATAKLFKAQAAENKALEPRAGFFEGDLLDGKGVIALADLPSREELLVKLLQTLQAAPRQVLGIIRAPARDLLYLLNNYANKLEDE